MKRKERFEIINYQSGVEVMIDKETGVNYLVRYSVHGISVTPLLDRDGKPLLTPVTNSNYSD